MNKTGNLPLVFAWSQGLLESAIPFAAFLAAWALGSQHLFWIGVTGWLLAVLHIYLQLPMIIENGKEKWSAPALGLMVPALLLMGKQIAENGTAWNYIIDQAMLGVVSLAAALCFLFIFSKGISGKSAWDDLGVSFTLIAVLLFGGAGSGLAILWYEKNFPGNAEQLTWIGLSFILAVRYRIKMMQSMMHGGTNPDHFYGDHFWVILAAIFIWILPIPLIGYLIFGSPLN